MSERSLRIALLYNLREDYPSSDRRARDSDADWDEPQTVTAIIDGLRAAGHDVANIGDPRRMLAAKVRADLDLVFSICEMRGLRHREALVPALCELLGLPYAFSPPDVMVMTLDKNLSNLLVRQAGGHVPPWAIVTDAADPPRALQLLLRSGPAIVKPVAEGSSMGISAAAIVTTETAALDRIRYIIGTYRQPAIIQRWVTGSEVTVGIVETVTGPTPLAPMEIIDEMGAPPTVYGYDEKETPGKRARLRPLANGPLAKDARVLALMAFKALGCRDAARIDLRFDPVASQLGFLEANPLPHLHPKIGDFCQSATTAGWLYPHLLQTIVMSAMRRSGPTRPARNPARRPR